MFPFNVSGDLTQPRVSQEYERGYKTLLEFLLVTPEAPPHR